MGAWGIGSLGEDIMLMRTRRTLRIAVLCGGLCGDAAQAAQMEMSQMGMGGGASMGGSSAMTAGQGTGTGAGGTAGGGQIVYDLTGSDGGLPTVAGGSGVGLSTGQQKLASGALDSAKVSEVKVHKAHPDYWNWMRRMGGGYSWGYTPSPIADRGALRRNDWGPYLDWRKMAMQYKDYQRVVGHEVDHYYDPYAPGMWGSKYGLVFYPKDTLYKTHGGMHIMNELGWPLPPIGRIMEPAGEMINGQLHFTFPKGMGMSDVLPLDYNNLFLPPHGRWRSAPTSDEYRGTLYSNSRGVTADTFGHKLPQGIPYNPFMWGGPWFPWQVGHMKDWKHVPYGWGSAMGWGQAPNMMGWMPMSGRFGWHKPTYWSYETPPVPLPEGHELASAPMGGISGPPHATRARNATDGGAKRGRSRIRSRIRRRRGTTTIWRTRRARLPSRI